MLTAEARHKRNRGAGHGGISEYRRPEMFRTNETQEELDFRQKLLERLGAEGIIVWIDLDGE